MLLYHVYCRGNGTLVEVNLAYVSRCLDNNPKLGTVIPSLRTITRMNVIWLLTVMYVCLHKLFWLYFKISSDRSFAWGATGKIRGKDGTSSRPFKIKGGADSAEPD